MGGALIKVFMILYSLELYFEPTEFVMPQKVGHNQFFSALYFYTKLLIFDESVYLKEGQIWGVGFPQICSNFRICPGFHFYGLFRSQTSLRNNS